MNRRSTEDDYGSCIKNVVLKVTFDAKHERLLATSELAEKKRNTHCRGAFDIPKL